MTDVVATVEPLASAPSSTNVATKKRPRSAEFLEGTSTNFTVEEVLRAGGGYRPSFRFRGYVTKGPQPNGQAAADSDTQVPNLHLVLRYEPPSPKFKRSNPGSVSYRMQVADGEDFLFSMRGLPAEMHVDKAAKMLAWGKLGIIFSSDAHLDQFLAAIKYVDITHTSSPTKAPAKATDMAESSVSRSSTLAADAVNVQLVTRPSLTVQTSIKSPAASATTKQGGAAPPARGARARAGGWAAVLAAVGAAAAALLLVQRQRKGARSM